MKQPSTPGSRDLWKWWRIGFLVCLRRGYHAPYILYTVSGVDSGQSRCYRCGHIGVVQEENPYRFKEAT
jgi:hypothetical protein